MTAHRWRGLYTAALVTILCAAAAAQQTGSDPVPPPKPADAKEEVAPVAPVDKRIFGVLPNYRTADANQEFRPITTRQKFTIASKDSFDWPIYMLSGAFAGLSQMENQNPSFGQGLKGYGRRYWRSFTDQAMGNMLTEAIVPSMFHEDPRYFQLGQGKTSHRIRYALTRILVTRTDSGGHHFNFSEVGGNSIAVAVSNAYYPETRKVSDNVQKLGIQLGTDAVSNVLKEFWPDIKRKLHHEHN